MILAINLLIIYFRPATRRRACSRDDDCAILLLLPRREKSHALSPAGDTDGCLGAKMAEISSSRPGRFAAIRAPPIYRRSPREIAPSASAYSLSCLHKQAESAHERILETLFQAFLHLPLKLPCLMSRSASWK